MRLAIMMALFMAFLWALDVPTNLPWWRVILAALFMGGAMEIHRINNYRP